MAGAVRRAFLVLSGIIGLLQGTAFAQAPAIAPPYQLISSQAVTRTHSDFTYKATLTSPGALASATATVVSLSPDTVVIDGSLTFGPVAAGGSALSIDTFVIRQNRAVAFNAANLVWTINPVPAPATATLLSVAPPAGQQGQTLSVALVGDGTHFGPTTTASFGAGIAVNSVTATDATHASANISIAPGAALGARNVSVTTGGETVGLTGAFTVTAGTPVLLSIDPTSGQQGQALNVALVGDYTHFGPTTIASFGAGITVNSVTPTDATHASASISIAPGATLGARNVSVTTGGETVGLTGAFTVTAGTPVLLSINPTSGQQGQALNVALVGDYTHFGPTTIASFGAGITVNSVTPTDATHASASISIAPGATLGARNVSVTTGGETVGLTGAFTVTAGTPVLLSINPTSGQLGQTLNVALVGDYTHFGVTTTASFGAGITVNSVTPTDATHASANISIAPGATLGARNVSVTTGSETVGLTAAFSVSDGTPVLLSVNPTSGQQGQTLNVALVGDYTHFGPTTTASFGAGITVNSVTATDATHASANISILPGATLGARNVSVTTGGETVGLNGAFSVTAGTPVLLSINPTSGQQGQTLNVALIGDYTHFGATTTASFGAGITVNSVTPTDATHASANISIAPGATLGARNVSVTTGGETVGLNGAFSVTAGTPVLLSINPTSGQQGQTLNVALLGDYTHFGATTTASFGAGITVNSVTATDATHASANISIAPGATLGARNVSVTTGGETVGLNGAFSVTAGTPVLLSINPTSGQQGQTLNVALIGDYTHFGATTTASFGAGITVNSVTPTDATHASANISIAPGATLGARNVSVTTGGETVGLNGAFSVTAGTPVLLSINPTSGQQGQTLNVALIGDYTHFGPTTTASFGAGITVNSVTATDATHASANISILPGATLGARNVSVTTGGETVGLNGAFSVTAGTPVLLSINPTSGQQGQTLNVALVGDYTHFGPTTTASFGAGITVNTVIATDATHASANISILPGATLGARNVSVTTGGETVGLNAAFTVTAGTPVLLSINPTSGQQGQTLSVALVGDYTHFGPTTTASFGAGITVNTVTATDATHASANISILPGATLGARNVSVTTGGETVGLAAAFNVSDGTPVLVSLNPTGGQQGQTLNVALVGDYTHFGPTTTASFGAGITVNSVTPTDATHASANISIAPGATLGARNVSVTTGGETVGLNAAFTVTAGTPVLLSINPTSGQQGQTLNVALVGDYTHFGPTTTASFGAGITVNSVTATDATHASANISILPGATLGARNVSVATGGETVGLNAAFSVTAGTPVLLSINPISGQQGQTLNVALVGDYTHFGPTTTASFGAGITVNSVTATDATHASANISIAPGATLGARNVSVTTGGETVGLIAAFNVSDGTPVLVSINPTSGQQGQTLNVALVGDYTHFGPTTTASFGAGITVNSVTATDATHASANISILPGATLGARNVSVTTGGETVGLTDAFLVTGQATIVSLSPNTAQQGQSNVSVLITGANTSFLNGTTVVSFGAGVAVNSLTVTDATHATANISVDPLTPIGGRTVTVTTNAEIATLPGGFTVLAGPAALTSAVPNHAAQGQLVSVTVTGSATHFAQGITTASFGGGINVGTVTVNSPTSATVEIAITAGASVGLRNVSLTTAGEIAIGNSLFVVDAATPVISSVVPGSGSQGQSLNVTVTGQFTHFVQGASNANFGAGVTVNSITVNSPTELIANISIDVVAFTGTRSVSVTTSGEFAAGGAFTVTAGPAAIASVVPNSAQQGQLLEVTIAGTATHFQQGVTTVSFGPDIAVLPVTVDSPTQLRVILDVAPSATVGARNVSVSTSGESATAGAAFTVNAGTPSITTVTPGSGAQGLTLNVAIVGQLTHFNQATTGVTFGTGVTVNSITVADVTHLTANIAIDPLTSIGSRTVTVTTGSEVVSSGFVVTAGSAAVTLTPNSGLQGSTGLSVAIAGSATHFLNGTTTANFGSGITVNSLTVNSATSATASITIANGASLGGRTVTLTTSGEIAAGTFTVQPGTPQTTGINPTAGVQGQTLDVAIAAVFTHFDGSTTVGLGSGVIVNSVTVTDATHLTANISINPTAATGGRTVTITTGAEVVTTSFTVTPGPAALTALSPNNAQQGTANLTVNVTGSQTHFLGGTTIAYFGGAIVVNSLTVNSATSATANITIPHGTGIGAWSVALVTDGEYAQGTFTVTPGTPAITSLTPNNAAQGQTLDVGVLAQFTTFGATTTADFGPAITVNSVTPNSATSATVNITIGPTAFGGFRSISLTTGTETVSSSFLVNAGPALIGSITPTSAEQGQTLNLAVTGQNTHFAQNITIGAFSGTNIVVNSITVNSATSATVNVTVQDFAAPGLRTLTLTTNGENASIINGFNVLAASPRITFVNPSSGVQGATINVAVTGQFTHFGPTTTGDFGAGITVNSVTSNSATSATVNITISPLAAVGSRTVTLATGTESASSLAAGSFFSVTPSGAAISQVTPNNGRQGESVAVTVTGTNTHFANGSTNLSVGGGIVVTTVTVNSPTELVASLNVGAGVSLGAHAMTATTLGEVATLAGAFTVNPGLPVVISVNPNTGRQAETLNVTVFGQFTTFNGTTAANFGLGITVNSVTPVNSTQATVNLTVTPGASTGSRTVTMTTGSETATCVGCFTVTPGIAGIAGLNPVSGMQGTSHTVIVTGQFTHFTNGVSLVSFGGGITVGTPTVNGPELLSVPISIATGTTIGGRSVTVTTGTESASCSGCFTVLQGVPSIVSIDPNAGQQGLTRNVVITGVFTNWVNGTTSATFGAGVTVNSNAVNSATSMTANITISPAATLGPRNVVVTTGAEVLTVTGGFTVTNVDTTPPQVLSFSPISSSADVPLNVVGTVEFNEPIDRNSITASSFYLFDTLLNVQIPGTRTVDATGRVVTLTPSQLLAVGRQYYFYMTNEIEDVAGNNFSPAAYYFTTGFSTDTVGPTLLLTNPFNGDTAVPLNTRIELLFDRRLNVATRGLGVQVTTGGSPVAGTYDFTDADYRLRFTPASSLAASTVYTVTVTSQLNDLAGNPVTNPGSFSFTTGTVADNTSPTVISESPTYDDHNVGLNVAIRARFSERINPMSLRSATNSVYLYNPAEGRYVGGTVTVDADRLGMVLTPLVPLDPFVQYYWVLSGFTDISGRANSWGARYFTTGINSDTTPPTVTAVSPVNGASGVPVNARLIITMSEAIDDSSVAGSVLITPAVPGTLVLGTDRVTLTYTPTGPLAVSTPYAVQINGLRDLTGNQMAPVSTSFTTAASAANDTTAPTVNTVSPTNGATNVPVNTPVTLTLSEPITAGAVGPSSFVVSASLPTLGTFPLAGVYSLNATNTSMTFTPVAPYPGGTQIQIRANNNSTIRDLAGNVLPSFFYSFTTAAASDGVRPTVIDITPADGSIGVGRNVTVAITFSESMATSTINASTLGVFAGSTRVGPSISFSADSRTAFVTFGTLQPATLYTIAATRAMQDLAGNALVDFVSSFTTDPSQSNTTASIVTPRPGNGATNVPRSSGVTLFSNKSLDAASVMNSLYVAQNGVLVDGTVVVNPNGTSIKFTPAAPFAYGSLINVFLGNTALDSTGLPISPFQSSFRIVADPTGLAPTLVASSPVAYSSNNPITSVIEASFSEPLDPATVSTATAYVHNSVGSPIAGVLSLRNGNRVIRFTPNAPLNLNIYYYVYLTNGLRDMQNVPFAGTNYYFYTHLTGAADTTAPLITSIVPGNGTTNIGTNTSMRIRVNEGINPLTATDGQITLTAGAPIPVSFSFNSGNDVITVTPQVPLPDNTVITLAVSGLQDPSGNTAMPASVQFTTGAGADTVRPTVVFSSVANGQTGVPVNSVFEITVDEPIDAPSLFDDQAVLYDYFLGQYRPATVSVSADGRTITVVPASTLPLGRQMGIFPDGVLDLAGNTWNSFALTFTTAFVGDAVPPVVEGANPPTGTTGVPLNVRMQVRFTEPIRSTRLGGISLLANGTPVATTRSLASDGVTVTLSPAGLLAAATNYTLNVNDVTDLSGNVQTAPFTASFTTETAPDLVTPVVVSRSIPSGAAGVPINASPRIEFNERLNPLTVRPGPSTLYIYQPQEARYIPLSVELSADLRSLTLDPNAPLQPNTQYYYVFNAVQDLAGNQYSSGANFFTTSTATDTTAPFVAALAPASGSSNLPVNTRVAALMSENIDPGSVGNTSVQLTPAVAGTVALATDGVTVTFTPSTNLAVSTTYSVLISGLRDYVGIQMAPVSATFTTRASAVADTTSPTVLTTSPVNSASGVAVNSPIILNLSEPIAPENVNADSFRVSVGSSPVVAGTYSVNPGGTVLTFTPAGPYPAVATIQVRANNNSSIRDFAGNVLSNAFFQFTTANTVDSNAPTVTLISPANGATGVGLNTTVALTFSEALNSATVNPDTITMFTGSAEFAPSVSLSTDGRTVFLSRELTPGLTYTVVVTSAVQDLSGNSVPDFFSTFSSVADYDGTQGSVQVVRPTNGASGISTNPTITLFLTKPVDPSSLTGAFVVTENGITAPGTTTLDSGGRTLRFTPFTPFALASYVQVFLTPGVVDTFGVPFANSESYFRVAQPVTGAPTIVRTNPAMYSSNNPRNPVVDVEFSQPLDPATVSGTTVDMRDPTNAPVAGTVSLRNGNRTIRFVPTPVLAANNYVYLYLSNGIHAADGTPFGGTNFYFYTSAVSDGVAPTATIVPGSGVTGLGTNAAIRVRASESLSPVTVNDATISVTSGGAIPVSLALGQFSVANDFITVTPQAALPANASIQVTVNGLEDPSGNPVPPQTVTFSTGPSGDFVRPSVIGSSVSSSQSDVPLNSVFELLMSEAIDPISPLNDTQFFYDYTIGYVAGTVSVSADGRRIFVAPGAALQPSRQYGIFLDGILDLAGNTWNGFNVTFTTASSGDVAVPHVVATNPVTGTVGVPTNAKLGIVFDEPIRPTSLGNIQLTQGGNPVAIAGTTVSNGNRSVALTLGSLLSPNLAYVLTIAGVQDVAGNTAPTVVVNFTTGAGVDVIATSSAPIFSPANNATLVSPSVAPQVTFAEPVDPVGVLSLTSNSQGVFLRVNATNVAVPATLSFSADYRTVILTPLTPLTNGTQYRLYYNGAISDRAGNTFGGATSVLFTIQP